MRLLLDQNLSYRLVSALADVFPDSVHVRQVGLSKAPDAEIWDYAAANHLTVVSKDWDFLERSLLEGYPPKVVWLRISNLNTEGIEAFMRAQRSAIENFHVDEEASLLVLS